MTRKPEPAKPGPETATAEQTLQPPLVEAMHRSATETPQPPAVTGEVQQPGDGAQQQPPPDDPDTAARKREDEERERARREEERKRVAAGYGLTDQEYGVLLRTTCKDAPREIAAWFMLFCKHRNLDPFSKQVYLWNDKYEDRNVPAEGGGVVSVKFPVGQWQVVTGIDGLRVIASRSPLYRGQLRPVWTYEPDPEQRDGIARFVKADSQYGKIAGKRRVEECEVIVRRAIPQAPTDSTLYLEFSGIARFDEFCKTNRDGKVIGNWEVQPEHQTRIRSEAMALRMAFPEEVGGIYLEDELRDRVDGSIDGAQPPALSVAATLEGDQPRDPRDDEIDRLRRALGWTTAKLRIESEKHGGGKDGAIEMLKAALEAKTSAAPKGGPRGAASDEAPAKDPLEGASCFWAEDGEACPDKPTHLKFDAPTSGPNAPADGKREKVPTCERHTGSGYGLNGEPIVALDRCAACNAKHGEEHSAGCPIDEVRDDTAAAAESGAT